MGAVINDTQTQNLQLSTAAGQQSSVSNDINQNIDTIKNVSSIANESSQKVLSMVEEINSAVNAINKQLEQFIKRK